MEEEEEEEKVEEIWREKDRGGEVDGVLRVKRERQTERKQGGAVEQITDVAPTIAILLDAEKAGNSSPSVFFDGHGRHGHDHVHMGHSSDNTAMFPCRSSSDLSLSP